MKLRYDFDSSQKSYRTFPQKVVHSTGLADRWSFLKWCCPFCLEKPRSRSRKSSGVPVIRITRPRSPDSDPDSEEEPEERRRGSVGSGGSSSSVEHLVRSPRRTTWATDGGDVLSQDSSAGSVDLDVIDEEINDPRDFDSDSIVSKDSVRSKGSVGSKSSVKSKSSVADSVKSKSSTKSKHGKESRKPSKESFKSSHDSVKDRDGIKDKSRSSVKRIFKHFKRSPSTASSTSSGSRGGDKRSSTKSSSSVAEAEVEDNKKTPKKNFSRPFDDKKRKSMTLDGRGRAAEGRGLETRRSVTSELAGQDVSGNRSPSEVKVEGPEVREVVAAQDVALRSNRSATLGGRSTSRRGMVVAWDPAGPDGEREPTSRRYKTTAEWEPKTHAADKAYNSPGREVEEDNRGKREEIRDATHNNSIPGELESSGDSNSTPPTPFEEILESEVVFRSPRRFAAEGEAERNKEKKEEEKQEEEEVGGGMEEEEEERVESCPPETPTQKDKVYGSSNNHHHYHQVADPGDESSTTCPTEEVGVAGGGAGQKSGSPSPLVGGGVGRTSGRDSVASSHASSTDTSCLTHADEEIERLIQFNEKKNTSLTPLGSRSESMASVCSAGAEGRYGTVAIKGETELGLQYNYKEGQLECHVLQCRDLAAVDSKRNRSDPYVKVYLLPDKSKSGKRKTKVKKHTLNPIFEEVLRFSTTMSELDSRTLWVSVWHSDMFGRNDFLGEVVIPLADTVFDDVSPKWYPLQDRMEPMEDLSYSPRGDLILALKFVPPDAVSSKKARRSRGALHVLVKEAKSLAAAKPHGTADPVCKGLLLPEKGKASKQKTSVCRKTLNPTWNHTLVFEDTSLQELTERALELSVWDHDRLGPSQFLGGCRLSLGKGKHGGRPVEWMEAAGMEVRLWEQMLDRPNLWVEGSIMLRPAMDKPIYSSSMTE